MPYSELAALLGGYFHQDWDIVADTLDGVLDAYAAETPPSSVRAAAAEARRFAADHPDQLLDAFETTFRPDITIGRDDGEARQWLAWLADGLDARLARK